ncbi:MAG TPA: hypothetical protein VLL08_10455 [Kineosporiaceae bacterium]|nr:hypothetical protein [Kineosporiaceae bacterium]
MALVVVASAKGAPGVTTLTVALAALAPGAIVADLDPDGGDLALRYGREDGAPLDPELGLLSLAASLRRDRAEVAGPIGTLDEHLQATAGGLAVLLGVTGPDQAVGLGPLWSPLARALAGSDRTIFADVGRVGPSSPAMPVLMQADAVLLLARAELEELAHLRERLRFLTAILPSRYAGPARVGVVLVAAERDRAAGPRTEQLLRASGLAVPVLGTIADDARGAARLRGLHGGRAGRTTLVRSVRSLLPAVTALTGNALTVGVLTEAALTNTAPSSTDDRAQPDRPQSNWGRRNRTRIRSQSDDPPANGEPINSEPINGVPVYDSATDSELAQVAAGHSGPAQVASAQIASARANPAGGNLGAADPAQVDSAEIDPAQVDPAQVDPAQVNPAQVEVMSANPVGTRATGLTRSARTRADRKHVANNGTLVRELLPAAPSQLAQEHHAQEHQPVPPNRDADIWLGTRAAATPAPPIEPAPPGDPALSSRSPYRQAWEPDADSGQATDAQQSADAEQVPADQAPEDQSPEDQSLENQLPADQSPENQALDSQTFDDQRFDDETFGPEQEADQESAMHQAADPTATPSPGQPSENGWPRPGRGSGTLSAATGAQNWGR